MVDKEFVHRKISLIEEELMRLIEFENLTLDQVAQDYKSQAIVERILERVITRAIDINQHLIAELGGTLRTIRSYRETFLRLADLGVYSKDFAQKVAPCAGLRNVLVHDYNNIDQELVHKSIQSAIQDFNEYAKYILSFISSEPLR